MLHGFCLERMGAPDAALAVYKSIVFQWIQR